MGSVQTTRVRRCEQRHHSGRLRPAEGETRRSVGTCQSGFGGSDDDAGVVDAVGFAEETSRAERAELDGRRSGAPQGRVSGGVRLADRARADHVTGAIDRACGGDRRTGRRTEVGHADTGLPDERASRRAAQRLGGANDPTGRVDPPGRVMVKPRERTEIENAHVGELAAHDDRRRAVRRFEALTRCGWSVCTRNRSDE